MPASLPSPQQFWRAVDLYLQEAWNGAPSRDVYGRLEALRRQDESAFFDSPVFERAGVFKPAGALKETESKPPGTAALEPQTTSAQSELRPARYSLRLGNRLYPHMKMTLEQAPEGVGFLYRADTHDRHCCPPPASREYQSFLKLMEENEAIARRIESRWEADKIPTFRQLLRDDLARRQVR